MRQARRSFISQIISDKLEKNIAHQHLRYIRYTNIMPMIYFRIVFLKLECLIHLNVTFYCCYLWTEYLFVSWYNIVDDEPIQFFLLSDQIKIGQTEGRPAQLSTEVLHVFRVV